MTYCMPHGVPDAMTVAELPFKTLHMPGVTVLLFEEFHNYRQIHTDGRQLPVDPNPRGSVRSCLAHRYADGRSYRASCLSL